MNLNVNLGLLIIAISGVIMVYHVIDAAICQYKINKLMDKVHEDTKRIENMFK